MHLIARFAARLVAATFLLLAPITVQAACQTSNASATFTDSSSYAVQSNSVAQVSASSGFTCTGSLIALVSTNYARATVASAGGWKLTGPTGDKIPYVVSADPAGAYSFAQLGTVNYMDPAMLSLLTILSGNTLAPKIYLTINGSANVAAGTYTDTLTVQWNWNICHGIGIGDVCILGETGSGTSTIPVTIVVGKDCQITAPPVAFGTVSLVTQFNEITQSVLIDCTKNTAYNVGFNSGTASSARPWRTMKSSSGNLLQYNLYRPDGVTIWDESNPLATPIAGSGSTTANQPFAYKARINPNQTAPVAGSYSDNVSVVVTF